MIGGVASGARLNLLMGSPVLRPASADIMRAFRKAVIAVSDTDPSGFSLEFSAARGGLVGTIPILDKDQLKPGSRIVATAQYGLTVKPVLDGIIGDVAHAPATDSAPGLLTVKGRDLTVLLDRETEIKTFEGMSVDSIVRELLAPLASKGVVPVVMTSSYDTPDLPPDRTPAYEGTPLAIIHALAKQAGYIFRFTPGPMPSVSKAYWGPATPPGRPMKAITTDMGAATNVANLAFENCPGQAASVTGEVLDPDSGVVVPIRSFSTGRLALGLRSALNDLSNHRVQALEHLPGKGPGTHMAKAQARSEATDDTVTAKGELDLARYGDLLEPGRLVGMRGAGWDNDGLYRVRDVVHTIEPGRWMQAFSLSRNGTGTTVPAVAV